MDVGIKDGRVTHLAPHLKLPAVRRVDATGLWVTPGFLDIHTHYDIELEIAPALSESVKHGVTTVVMGNCSLSLTLGEPQTLADIFLRVENIPRVLVQKWLGSAFSWANPAEYFAHLRELPLGPNVAPLLGHSALRAAVMGLKRSLTEKATDEDIQRMRQSAEAALDAGCIGISVDMVPWHMMSGRFRGRTIPSQHADFREYKMLAQLCRERDAVFQATPNPQRPLSLWDIFRLAMPRGGRPLRATLLSALDPVHHRALWRGFSPLLRLLNNILDCNIRFQTVTEPFLLRSDGPLTPLFEEFPAGVLLNDQETTAQRRALWRSPGFRERFRKEWLSGPWKTFHRDLSLMKILGCPDGSLIGQSFAQIAAHRRQDALEVFMDLLEAHDDRLRWAAVGANDRPEPRLALLADPHILPGFTDAGAHVRNLAFYDGALSLLRQAVSTGFMTPERAIERSTGEPAKWFRLDRGVLQPGAKADIVLLDPAKLVEPPALPIEVQDPVLEGAMRMVKPDTDVVREAFIAGRSAFCQGEASTALGREPLGEVLGLHDDPTDEASLKSRMRLRINDEIIDHPFADYWDVFVLKHQEARNVACHMAGVVIFYGLWAAAWLFKNPWLLLALPSSQIVGLIGHRLFERSYIDPQDAKFSLRASWSLNKMFVFVLTGRYGRELSQLKNRLRMFQEKKSTALGMAPTLRIKQPAMAANLTGPKRPIHTIDSIR